MLVNLWMSESIEQLYIVVRKVLMTNIYLPCAINATYVPIKTFITQLSECFLVNVQSKIRKNPCSCKECCFSFPDCRSLCCLVFRGSRFKEPTLNSFIQCPMRQLAIPRLTSSQSYANFKFPTARVFSKFWFEVNQKEQLQKKGNLASKGIYMQIIEALWHTRCLPCYNQVL